jgi:1,4-alpha-glucan branching enzyme
LNSDSNAYDAYFVNSPSFDTAVDGGGLDGMPFSANLGIGPYTAVVLSQDA